MISRADHSDERAVSPPIAAVLLLGMVVVTVAVTAPVVVGIVDTPQLSTENADLAFSYQGGYEPGGTDSFGTVGSDVNADGMIEIRVEWASDGLTADQLFVDSSVSGGNLADETSYGAGEDISTGDTVTVWANGSEAVSVAWMAAGDGQSNLLSEFTVPETDDRSPDDENDDSDDSDDENDDCGDEEDGENEEDGASDCDEEYEEDDRDDENDDSDEDEEDENDESRLMFRGGGNAQVQNVEELNTTDAVIYVKDDGDFDAIQAEVDSKGNKNIRPVAGGKGNVGTIVAVYLNATNKTYVHPGYDPADETVSSDGGAADPVCDGPGSPDETVDDDGTCTAPDNRSDTTSGGDDGPDRGNKDKKNKDK